VLVRFEINMVLKRYRGRAGKEQRRRRGERVATRLCCEPHETSPLHGNTSPPTPLPPQGGSRGMLTSGQRRVCGFFSS
jgi:hypothetical protein